MLLSFTLYGDQFSFILYNDFFAGTDKHFTNGLSLSWIDEKRYFKHYYGGLSLSQMIFTPIDTTQTQPQYDDIPYIGYLYLSGYLFEIKKESFKEYRVEIGLTGKYAYAKEVQNSFHTLIKNDEAKGWNTQLGTYYTLSTLMRYGEISYQKTLGDNFAIDWFNHVGIQVGNFVDNIFWGSTFRIGKNYAKNFNLHYPYLTEQITQFTLNKEHKGFGYSLSLGVNADYLFYSLLLSKAQDEGYNVEQYNFNGSIYVGYDLYYDRHKITMFYQHQSPYTAKQNEINTLAGLLYSYQF